MEKKYTSYIVNREARPRSKRLQRLGGGTKGTSSVVQSTQGTVGSGGETHSHPNLPYLNQISTDNDGYLYLTLNQELEDGSIVTRTIKVMSGYSDESGHAKDADKWAGHLFGDYMDQPVRKTDFVRFKQVISSMFRTPDFIPGIETGAGAAIDETGNGEMNGLTLRSFLKVPQLIYNKIRVTGGEMWNTEGGTVKSVTKDPDSAMAYTLELDVEDGDNVELAVDDICKARYNSNGTMITSYFRVTAVDEAAKSIRIVLGADAEVPGGVNAAPVPFMNIARYGNFTDAERQRSQYFSSSEMRISMLAGVDQYIIQPKHYKTVWGSVPDALIPDGIPLAKGQASMYLDTVLTRNLIQLDSSGNRVKTIRDRGLWSAAVTDYLCNDEFQDEVYHKSCKYRCIVEGTLQEPRYDSSDWLLVAGDTTLELIIDSTAGETFLYGCLETTLMAVVRRGVNDITDEILDSDWTWSRDTGDAAADGVWNADHSGCGRSVDLTQEDLPVSSGRFICRAYVRDGAESVEAEVVF